MAERMVQMPVSLIEQMQRYFRSGSDTLSRRMAAELTALLSQPNQPDSLPGLTPSELRAWRSIDAQQSARPAPLRVEDMAPGTTFTGTTRQGFTQRFERVSRGRVKAENGTLWSPLDYQGRERIDPSTIRDVQPPEDAA